MKSKFAQEGVKCELSKSAHYKSYSDFYALRFFTSALFWMSLFWWNHNLLKKNIPFHFIWPENKIELKNKLAIEPILIVYSLVFN